MFWDWHADSVINTLALRFQRYLTIMACLATTKETNLDFFEASDVICIQVTERS